MSSHFQRTNPRPMSMIERQVEYRMPHGMWGGRELRNPREIPQNNVEVAVSTSARAAFSDSASALAWKLAPRHPGGTTTPRDDRLGGRRN